VATYLQPSTSPLLMSMHNTIKKYNKNNKFQKYTYKEKNVIMQQ